MAGLLGVGELEAANAVLEAVRECDEAAFAGENRAEVLCGVSVFDAEDLFDANVVALFQVEAFAEVIGVDFGAEMQPGGGDVMVVVVVECR